MGEPGEVGPEGPQGIPGQTPEITVEQNTPTVYKVRFKTAETDFLTPNLKAVPEVYNANLSSAGSVLTVPLEALNMTLQNTSATSLRFSLQPAERLLWPIFAAQVFTMELLLTARPMTT